MLFFGLLGAAEANESLAASFGGREAALEIFLDGELEMSGHFLVEVAIELRAAEQRAHAVERLMKPIGHGSGPIGFINLSTACALCSAARDRKSTRLNSSQVSI